MDELYLDNIDEYVNDQNKIVTYKWLSLTLGVHVNTAKQMLYHYLDQRRKERSGTTLHATYLVSGKCSENGSVCHKVSVVREDQLDDTKSKLDKTISVHVYSVQKAELKDSGPLYSTDYDAVKENLKNCNKYSTIRCAAAVPLSHTELQKVQEKVVEKEATKPSLNDHTAAAPKPSVKQPKGIMGMFSNKAAPKSEACNKEVKTEQKDEASPTEGPKSKVSSKANAMNNFFGKSADKKVMTDKPDKNIKEETEGAQSSSAAVSSKPSQSSSKSKQDIKEEQPKESKAVKDDSKDSRSKTKRLEHSDSEEERADSQKKKRRRIKKPQSDSSDDEVIPDSPPVPEVQTPSPGNEVKKEPVSHQEASEGRRRKRRRVLKARTFLDDEGCMVTEKGYESESYSESEDDSKTTSQPSGESNSLKQSLGKREEEKTKERGQKKAPAAAAAANKSTKQSSIMGFFQKK
ncbi:DNA polymerase delta subunit 3 isoform X2 [Astyanax mexicanus]|uniref:DNA polymerase delta subunit 3 n=1 Tax=Astyanax mexicanus TaxID=7994 RepID=A0A8B9JFV0_ASTMX|nr:DNA polymerase delta subunit 3 isoform X2 [Astyanax mexicanus]